MNTRRRSLLVLGLSMVLLGGVAQPAGAARAINFTIRDLSGRYVRLSDFKDKLVYMSFWATWCKPCISELKHLRKLYKRYKSKGFVVLAVSIDGPETRAKVKSAVKRYKLTFPVVVDIASRLVKLYNPKRTLPFSVMIKGNKILKTRATFQVSDVPQIEKEIKAAL